MTARVKNKIARMNRIPFKREKKIFPHVSIVLGNEDELKAFDEAIAEERKATGMTRINRSRIVRKLIKKWVNYEVTI